MRIITLSIISFLCSCNPKYASTSWEIILKTDPNGIVLKGAKENLVYAIRQGADIKIGWGHQGERHTIEHLSRPIWIGLLDGQEVIARLHPQVGSKVDWNTLNSTYKANKVLNEEWRVIISTKGTFDAVWIDRKTKEVIKRVPQKHPLTWFAKGFDAGKTPDKLYTPKSK